MLERIGNIWSVYKHPNQIILCTTNNVVGRNGLVMGAGIAKEAAQRLPELSEWMRPYCGSDYLLKIFYSEGIGCLQTKRHWKDQSPIDLVKQSIAMLHLVALSINDHEPIYTYHLTRPGTGLGGLSWDHQVKEICEALPNNCVVWNK